MKTIFILFPFILLTVNTQACDIILNLNKSKKYYSEFIQNIESPISIEILSKNIKVKEINVINNNDNFTINSVEELKRNKRRVLVTKNDKVIEKKLKIEIKDSQDISYFLTIFFFSKVYNIDEVPEELHLKYNRSLNYPPLLRSNSHVIGNYFIFDKSGKIISTFEVLSTFSIILDAVDPGEYFICEDNFDNKLFSITII